MLMINILIKYRQIKRDVDSKKKLFFLFFPPFLLFICSFLEMELSFGVLQLNVK